MTANVIHTGIQNLVALQQDLEIQLNDFPVRNLQSSKVAENVRISLGHLKRASEYLHKAKREAAQ